jgi:hypothetical protein
MNPPRRTRRALVVVSWIAAILSVAPGRPAHADDSVGRYQMVTIPSNTGSFDSRVMILDTRDGHLWQWWETPTAGSGGNNAGITYLGKVQPGSSIGETVPVHRGGPPEPILPRKERP